MILLRNILLCIGIGNVLAMILTGWYLWRRRPTPKPGEPGYRRNHRQDGHQPWA